jgi:hypothetical protein
MLGLTKISDRPPHISARPDLPVIMVTGSMGEEKAVSLLKMGVRDFGSRITWSGWFRLCRAP